MALAVRALRHGSVCLDLRSVEQQQIDVDEWLAAIKASPLAAQPPVLHVDGDLLYLDRYWLEEQQVCRDVLTMVDAKPKQTSPDIDRLFPKGFEEQRAAAEVALSQGLTVLTGGPGTGKTTTVARLLALLTGGTHLRIALAAPTGKAAARLQEAVQLEVGQAGTSGPGRRWRDCTRRHCTGCWAAARTRRRGFATIGATGSHTTSSWWTRRRWCR